MQIDPILPITLLGINAGRADLIPTGAGKPRPVDPAVEVRQKSLAETERALHELGRAIEPLNISLKFTRDQDTGTIVVEMIDQQSGERLKQIPNEASLHVAASLSKLQG